MAVHVLRWHLLTFFYLKFVIYFPVSNFFLLLLLFRVLVSHENAEVDRMVKNGLLMFSMLFYSRQIACTKLITLQIALVSCGTTIAVNSEQTEKTKFVM